MFRKKNLFLSVVILFEFTNLDTSTPSFWIDSKFDHISLEAISKLFKKEQFYATGYVEGSIYLKTGQQTNIEAIDIKLKSLEPGGELKTPLLSRLTRFIPESPARDTIIASLGKDTFAFKHGGVELSAKEQGYMLHILLDGEHLMEFNINISQELVNSIFSKLAGGGAK